MTATPGAQVNPTEVAQAHIVDPGNVFVLSGPRSDVTVVMAQAQDDAGPLFVATIRTGTVTLTLKVSREQALQIGAAFTGAAGAQTYKLPYGHRGVNQPVQDMLTRRCYITSQNHGYAVKDDTLGADWEPWFVNVNDGTNEGVRARSMPVSSVQFHPEATPGPEDTAFLFDDFLRLAGSMKR